MSDFVDPKALAKELRGQPREKITQLLAAMKISDTLRVSVLDELSRWESSPEGRLARRDELVERALFEDSTQHDEVVESILAEVK